MTTKPSPLRDDPLANGDSGALDQHKTAALRALLLATGGVTLATTLALFVRDGIGPLMLVATAATALLWLMWILFRRGHVYVVAQSLVVLLLLVATAAIVLNGSVRSAGVFVMLAAISIGGALLTPRSLVAAGLYGIASLCVLNLLEQRHLLPGQLPPTGWTVWLVQAGVILVSLISTLFGRNRLMNVVRNQEQALQQVRAAEAGLRASEGRFMGLFRNNPAATVVQRVSTREVLDANEAFVRMFGHPRDVLVGQPPPPLWAHSADQLTFRQTLHTEGRVHGMRSQGLRMDGGSFEMLVYSEFVTEGPERLVITMVLDVSAEEASRQALERSEERFSKAFNFSPLGMTITRLSDGLFMEVNPANERVLGYTQDDFTGKTATEAGVWLSDADRMAYVNTLQRDGRLLAYETRMRTKSGEAVDVRIWAEIIDIGGETCALSFTLNVAEEKQREAMLMNVAEGVSAETGEAFFRSLADHLASAIGADGVLIGEVVGQQQIDTLSVLWQGVQKPNQRHHLARTACSQTLDHTDLFVCPKDIDQHFRLLPPFEAAGVQALAGAALRDADGSAIGLLTAVWRKPMELSRNQRALLSIFVSRCNAELVRLRRDRQIEKLQSSLEQRVRRRTAQLEYLNRELDSFAYTVSHDLKSPLRSIDGFNHLLREQLHDRLTDDDRSLFERVDTAVQRMNRLITDLLALARVSQGTLQRMNTNLSELAEDVMRSERHRDPTRSVTVTIAAGLFANCDARLAHIVLENLLGNAWKYTGQSSDARIEFGCADSAPGTPPVFFVQDNGAGFDMARSERLFKAFNRLHASSEFEGSGIGLATVRRILERHGGFIRGEGAVGQGARFEFSFGSDTLP
jgi:PAS domain S-box-containing protein